MAQFCASPFVHASREYREIRGRTRGIGNEFVLACDMRFAGRQTPVFGNPEVGVGLIPGGGALEWLPRLVGRSRALEFVLSAGDFDADIAERYGWVNRTLDDRSIQFTPSSSACSLHFGTIRPPASPPSAKGYLVVSDIVAARNALLAGLRSATSSTSVKAGCRTVWIPSVAATDPGPHSMSNPSRTETP